MNASSERREEFDEEQSGEYSDRDDASTERETESHDPEGVIGGIVR